MKCISPNVAARVARAACAMLLTAPLTFAFAQQQPARPALPPHGLTSNNATSGIGASDTLLTAKAKTALLAAKDVHSSQIKVTTAQGVVTLSGTVPSAAEKDRAEHTVQDLDGVVSVNNTLSVDAPR